MRKLEKKGDCGCDCLACTFMESIKQNSKFVAHSTGQSNTKCPTIGFSSL